MLHYGDDFLAWVHGARIQDRALLLQHRRRVEQVLHSLSLTRNVDKGHWDPTTSLDHLGLTVSTTNRGGEYNIPEAKQTRIRHFAKDLLQEGKRNRRLVPVRRIEQVFLVGRRESLW